MSQRASLVVLALLVLAVIAGFALWKPDASADPVSAAPVASAQPAAVAGATAEALEDGRAARAAVAADIAPAAAPSPPPTEAAAPKADLSAKTPLEIVVVDDRAQPVFDAEIQIGGMRSEASPGSWYQYRGEALVARTDARGRARFDVWTWTDLDGRTTHVDVTVKHAEFVPFRDSSFALGPGERRIELARGAVVSVRAWHGAPGNVVGDVTIRVEREAALAADAWTRESDGRLVTTRIAPGTHVMRVTSAPGANGGSPLHSALETFTVRANERVDLSIQLFPALEWTGTLDDSVPRPVVDGRVMLYLVDALEGDDARACISHAFETRVAPDGTFAIRDLPRGRGYVFALCSGHVSALARAPTLADAGIRLREGATAEDEARAWVDFAAIAQQLQRTDVPAATTPVVIAMTATGSVEVTVTEADGTPLSDAVVYASPNVRVPRDGSTLVPWREWERRTDANGVARFDDVPTDGELWLGASARGFRMNAADRQRSPSVVVTSEGIAKRTIALELAEVSK